MTKTYTPKDVKPQSIGTYVGKVITITEAVPGVNPEDEDMKYLDLTLAGVDDVVRSYSEVINKTIQIALTRKRLPLKAFVKQTGRYYELVEPTE